MRDFEGSKKTRRNDLISPLTPPHSLEAEQSVLGGLLLDALVVDSVIDILKQNDFYKNEHKTI